MSNKSVTSWNNNVTKVSSEKVRAKVLARSGGHCEAMVDLGRIWTRCGKRDIELHHRLTRARGGVILDDIGETYHLMHLCHSCHMRAHDQSQAFETGMLLDGSMVSGLNGPVYTGSDQYLLEMYGERNKMTEWWHDETERFERTGKLDGLCECSDCLADFANRFNESPRIKDLAKELGISVGTVYRRRAKAQRMGWLIPIRKHGNHPGMSVMEED